MACEDGRLARAPKRPRCRYPLLGVASGLLLVGCSQQSAASSEVIRGTTVSVDRLLLMSGRDHVFLGPEIDQPLCMAESLLPSFTGKGLNMVAGHNPFAGAAPITASCRLVISPDPIGGFKPDATFSAGPCESGVRLKGDRIDAVHIRITRTQPDDVHECIYRLGLFLQGFNGSLSLPADAFFVDTARSPYRNQDAFVGNRVPIAVIQFRMFCSDIPLSSSITRASLADGICKEAGRAITRRE